MSTGDFLRKDAQTPFTEHYLMAGVHGVISTNLQAVLDAARESFCPLGVTTAGPRLCLRLWVDPKGTTQPPWPKPFFRGLGHLIFVGFDAQSSVLIDLRSRRALGRFSPALGAERAYWKRVILPVLVSILSASVGVTELHCGCVAKEGNGLLLAGRSGSGKSTLALALAHSGFEYLSDDRTFCLASDGKPAAWGLPTLLKLRPESAKMFPEFRGLEPVAGLNGEQAFFIDPDSSRDLKRVRHCEPRWLVFLERQAKDSFELAPMPSTEAASRLAEDLLAETPELAELQHKTIAGLMTLPCWRLRYGGQPQSVAEELARHFETARQRTILRACVAAPAVKKRVAVTPPRQDPLRRFAPTPYSADLPLMGRTLRVETNSPAILARTVGVFARYKRMTRDDPDFRWRIVSEPRVRRKPPWPEISAFSGEGLRFVNIGQRNFIAVDLDSREAVAALAEGLAEDPLGFCTPFLDDLFCLTAGALGLVPLTAACVASGDKGILLLGPPKSGKTTTSYLAAQSGLEFFADQAVFLELATGQLHAWGDFLPAVFRPETVQFLPELRETARPFHYLDLTLLYLERNSSQLTLARPVAPICCVFLERQTSRVPRLTPLGRAESRRRLLESLPFKDDHQFEAQRDNVLTALAELPSYALGPGSDLGTATRIYRSLLLDHDLLARIKTT